MEITKVIEASDNLAKVVASVSERLDPKGSVSQHNLIALCQSCKESLDDAVDEYLRVKKECWGDASECQTLVEGQFDFTKEEDEAATSWIKSFVQACKDSAGGTQTFKEG